MSKTAFKYELGDPKVIKNFAHYTRSNYGFKVIRSVFQGKISCDVTLENDKGFISFQSGSYRADAVQSGSCSVSTLDVDLSQVSDSVKPGVAGAAGVSSAGVASPVISGSQELPPNVNEFDPH